MKNIFILFLIFITVKCQSNTFFHLSDIHLDLLSNPSVYNSTTLCRPPKLGLFEYDEKTLSTIPESSGEFGQFGCDSIPDLFNSAIIAMNQIETNPDFIIVTGDAAPHQTTSWSNVQESVTHVYNVLNTTYPNIPIVPAFGNADFYPDYNATCNAHYDFWFDLWSSWIPESQQTQFLISGAYSTQPIPGLTIISINTILYDVHNPNNEKPDDNFLTKDDDPCGQFAWLKEQLIFAKNQSQNVYIIGHSPPGIDDTKSFKVLWNDSFIDRFFATIEPFSDIIVSMFFGHLHRDEFRVPGFSVASDIPILLTASLTPIFLNNPSIRLVYYNLENILDYEDYYLDLLQANEEGNATFQFEYSFSESYGVNGSISSSVIEQILFNMTENVGLYESWYSRWAVQYDGARIQMLCAQMYPKNELYEDCLAKYSTSRKRKSNRSEL